MAVGADNLALRYLCFEPRHADPASCQKRHRTILVTEMIELQHLNVGDTAVRTGVLAEILDNQRKIAFCLPFPVALIAIRFEAVASFAFSLVAAFAMGLKTVGPIFVSMKLSYRLSLLTTRTGLHVSGVTRQARFELAAFGFVVRCSIRAELLAQKLEYQVLFHACFPDRHRAVARHEWEQNLWSRREGGT